MTAVAADSLKECIVITDPPSQELRKTELKKKRGRPSVLTNEERKVRRRERDKAKSKKKYEEKRQGQIEKATKESLALRSHPDGLATLFVDDEREGALTELQQCDVELVQRPILPKPIVIEVGYDYELQNEVCKLNHLRANPSESNGHKSKGKKYTNGNN